MDAPIPGRSEVWTVGDRPRTVAIWTTVEWDAMAPDQRPVGAIMIGGIGWVVVLPEEGSAGPPEGLPRVWQPHP
jgi:hypothetical protein